MAVIAVNSAGSRVQRQDAVLAALAPLSDGAPVTVMTHGFRYCPYRPETNPHRMLFSTDRRKTNWKSVSWAHYLRLDRRGLGIGFGWPGTGRLDQAAMRAFAAGEAMGHLISAIIRERPDLRISIVAHSLGARVALRALADQRAGAVDAVVLLSGAEFRGPAARAAFSPAGRAARFLNVTSGENLAFDALFRLFAPTREMLAPALSAGLGQPHSGWIDLKIDDPAHLATLRGLGYRPSRHSHRVCHWSSFLRPGLFPLYRDLLGDGGAAGFARLSAALPQSSLAARALPRLPALARLTARP